MTRSAFALVGVCALFAAASADAAPCETLAKIALPHTTITAAEQIPAGAFVPPGARPAGAALPAIYAKLPEFCRVTATLAPSSDSDIKIEVWMPLSNWNGTFQAVGNGGWAGTISYAALAAAVAGGYATASTDTGHVGGTAAFALGHPEKVVDFGYRAVHEMTVQAKAVVDAFYGSLPKLSIWNGCSQGGRQGVTEAVRFPADFDAIIAGAPAVNGLQMHVGRMAMNRSVNRTAETAIPREKYPAIHSALLSACDAKDGIADGVVENPLSCRFEPKVLQCKAQNDASCLTAPQIESALVMYNGAADPRTGARRFPGLAPGSELGWNVIGAPQPLGLATEAFKYVIAKDATWEPARFNAATDFELAASIDKDDVLNSSSPDMKAFFARGGKLLLYHGWSDPQVTPLNTVDFFSKVVALQGSAVVGKSVQLYMVPGMNHCQGGPGTDTFDKMGAIEQWIKTGVAPDKIPASHLTNGVVDRTRPLCPFGQVAKWNGVGSSDDAANFACVADAAAVK
jgi:feruloyl esterase